MTRISWTTIYSDNFYFQMASIHSGIFCSEWKEKEINRAKRTNDVEGNKFESNMDTFRIEWFICFMSWWMLYVKSFCVHRNDYTWPMWNWLEFIWFGSDIAAFILQTHGATAAAAIKYFKIALSISSTGGWCAFELSHVEKLFIAEKNLFVFRLKF